MITAKTAASGSFRGLLMLIGGVLWREEVRQGCSDVPVD